MHFLTATKDEICSKNIASDNGLSPEENRRKYGEANEEFCCSSLC